MTEVIKPQAKTCSSVFLFRPLRQAAGLGSLQIKNVEVAGAFAPRQDRQSRVCSSAIDLMREVLQACPIRIVSELSPVRIPVPSKWRCGRCSAQSPSRRWHGKAFGEGWVTDAVKQLKLDPNVVNAPIMASSPILNAVDFSHDVLFTWNGTTSGVRVPNGDWIAGRPRRPDLRRRDQRGVCL